MKTKAYRLEVNLPEVDEYLRTYSRYSSLARGEGQALFDAVMQPETFVKASVISDLGLPAVLAVADMSKNITDMSKSVSLDSFTKQFIGSVVCSLMEANGYAKTGKKRRVPHESFSVGECYIKKAGT